MRGLPTLPKLATMPSIGRGAGGFSPRSLFANGEQGVWYDPSDLGSMFQDVSGTIPAAVGQPVGLILDKSGNGNHASQATATARPTLGRMPAGGRRNLLTHTENLADPAWFKRAADASAGAAAAPDGTMTASRVVAQAGPYADRTRGSVGQEAVGNNKTFSLFVKSAGAPFARLYVSIFLGIGWVIGVDLTTGDTTTFSTSVFSASTVSVAALSGGWFKVVLVVRNASHPSINYAYGVTGALAAPVDFGAPPSGSLDTSGGVYVWHPQVEAGEVATPYQRVGASRYDVTEAGVQSLSYLYRDPVDDTLPWTAPAGSYDIVHIPLTGPATVLTAQALSGAANILLAENTRAYLAIDRRLTGAEIDALAAYYGASA